MSRPGKSTHARAYAAHDATTLAFEMWRKAFSGQNRFGYGAAVATFLMLLFVPFLLYQVRSQRKNA